MFNNQRLYAPDGNEGKVTQTESQRYSGIGEWEKIADVIAQPLWDRLQNRLDCVSLKDESVISPQDNPVRILDKLCNPLLKDLPVTG